MTDINEILKERKNTLVNQVSEVSKSKYFNIIALSYCLGFIEESVKQLNTSRLEDTYTPNFLNEDLHLPPEFIAREGNKLISDRFDGFNIIEGFPQTTRITNYLRSQLFIAVMTELEDYFVRIIEIILLAYPEKLHSKNFNVVKVLKQDNAADKIQEEVTKKIAKHSSHLFDLLLKTLKMETTINQILPEYVEMKLRRNLGVHNGWERNERYTEGIKDRGKVYQGDFLAVDSDYFGRSIYVSTDIVAQCNSFCKLRFSGNT